jgi:hypothetical protein
LVKCKEEEKKRRRKTELRTTIHFRCCTALYQIGHSHTLLDSRPTLTGTIDSVAITESSQSPPQQKRENRTHAGAYRKEKRNMIIKKILVIGEEMVELQANAVGIS